MERIFKPYHNALLIILLMQPKCYYVAEMDEIKYQYQNIASAPDINFIS
jgi:hypothetical protein